MNDMSAISSGSVSNGKPLEFAQSDRSQQIAGADATRSHDTKTNKNKDGAATDTVSIADSSSTNTYSSLIASKQNLVQAADKLSSTNDALNKASDVLGKIESQVKSVKNYPPGNEDRMQYLMSIKGLRDELKAITIPHPEGGAGGLSDSKNSMFPELDPRTANDKAVQQTGDAATALKDQVNAAQQGLQAQAHQIYTKYMSEQLPQQNLNDGQAVELAKATAGMLAGARYSVTASNDLPLASKA